MIIMVIADNLKCWDDGCSTVIIGNTIDEVERQAKTRDLYERPFQVFQIDSNHITTIGEVTEIDYIICESWKL